MKTKITKMQKMECIKQANIIMTNRTTLNKNVFKCIKNHYAYEWFKPTD